MMRRIPALRMACLDATGNTAAALSGEGSCQWVKFVGCSRSDTAVCILWKFSGIGIYMAYT